MMLWEHDCDWAQKNIIGLTNTQCLPNLNKGQGLQQNLFWISSFEILNPKNVVVGIVLLQTDPVAFKVSFWIFETYSGGLLYYWGYYSLKPIPHRY